jgi:hypothetical protein
VSEDAEFEVARPSNAISFPSNSAMGRREYDGCPTCPILNDKVAKVDEKVTKIHDALMGDYNRPNGYFHRTEKTEEAIQEIKALAKWVMRGAMTIAVAAIIAAGSFIWALLCNNIDIVSKTPDVATKVNK